MKLIAFILINCTYKIASSKPVLVSSPEDGNTNNALHIFSKGQQLDADFLNTRDIDYTDYYGSYMPADYGNLGFISNWVNSIANLMPTYQQPVYDTQTYQPYYTDYNEEQWSSQYWPRDWSQSHHTNPHSNQIYNPNTAEHPQWVGTNSPHASSFYPDQYQQPAVTKKISTVFNTEDSKEIKHKVIISPEHPNGTGYISIGSAGGNQSPGNSSKDGKVYYRF